MGYLYGKGGLLCDICGATGATKRRCPQGWCQPIATCGSESCEKGLAKHVKEVCQKACKEHAAEARERDQRELEMLRSGRFVRFAAATKGRTIHVLFRDQERRAIGFYMAESVYRAFPLSEPVTPDDFRRHGELTEAPAEFFG